MEKINFKNLPSTDTPINADNLNLLQDNVEDALFSGDYDDLTNKPTIPEVVDSLNSDSTTNAPSVHTIKEHLVGTILYDDSIGETGDITLNDAIENYTTFKVFFTSPNAYIGISDFFVTSGATYTIDKNRIDSLSVLMFQEKIQISGTSLTKLANRTYTATSGSITDDNPISINKIIGYK